MDNLLTKSQCHLMTFFYFLHALHVFSFNNVENHCIICGKKLASLKSNAHLWNEPKINQMEHKMAFSITFLL